MCELIAEKHSDWDDSFRIPILAALIVLSSQYPDLADLITEIDAAGTDGSAHGGAV